MIRSFGRTRAFPPTAPRTPHLLTRIRSDDSVVSVARESDIVLEPVERVEDGHEAVEVDGRLGGQQRRRGGR